MRPSKNTYYCTVRETETSLASHVSSEHCYSSRFLLSACRRRYYLNIVMTIIHGYHLVLLYCMAVVVVGDLDLVHVQELPREVL